MEPAQSPLLTSLSTSLTDLHETYDSGGEIEVLSDGSSGSDTDEYLDTDLDLKALYLESLEEDEDDFEAAHIRSYFEDIDFDEDDNVASAEVDLSDEEGFGAYIDLLSEETENSSRPEAESKQKYLDVHWEEVVAMLPPPNPEVKKEVKPEPKTEEEYLQAHKDNRLIAFDGGRPMSERLEAVGTLLRHLDTFEYKTEIKKAVGVSCQEKWIHKFLLGVAKSLKVGAADRKEAVRLIIKHGSRLKRLAAYRVLMKGGKNVWEATYLERAATVLSLAPETKEKALGYWKIVQNEKISDPIKWKALRKMEECGTLENRVVAQLTMFKKRKEGRGNMSFSLFKSRVDRVLAFGNEQYNDWMVTHVLLPLLHTPRRTESACVNWLINFLPKLAIEDKQAVVKYFWEEEDVSKLIPIDKLGLSIALLDTDKKEESFLREQDFAVLHKTLWDLFLELESYNWKLTAAFRLLSHGGDAYKERLGAALDTSFDELITMFVDERLRELNKVPTAELLYQCTRAQKARDYLLEILTSEEVDKAKGSATLIHQARKPEPEDPVWIAAMGVLEKNLDGTDKEVDWFEGLTAQEA
tara:strand:- start:109178 stop:110923 length:1746 start_codon:yes stop_codon:yes gene_type:complete